MAKKRVYVDSGVLIVAFRAGEPGVSDAAIELLGDDETEHLYSLITQLEVMPLPTFNKREDECAFYLAFFEAASRVPCTEETINDALHCANVNGLSACDAMHVACAVAAGADEFVTAEKRSRLPSAPEPGIPIRSLRG